MNRAKHTKLDKPPVSERHRRTENSASSLCPDARLLSCTDAATYCGVSRATYRAWLDKGLLPKAIRGTRRYDKKALDDALDKLSGISDDAEQCNDYDAWKANNASQTETR